MFKNSFTKILLIIVFGVVALLSSFFFAKASYAQQSETNSLQGVVEVYFFGREDCKFCQREKAFFEDFLKTNTRVVVHELDIVKDAEAKKQFQQITKTHDLPRVTPLTLVGGGVIQGFDTHETTGVLITQAIERAYQEPPYILEDYLNGREVFQSGSGCDAEGNSLECETGGLSQFTFKLPVLGVVDLRDFSLFTLAGILGLVDGFNPCAMWVLVTFLLILLQIGDRKKMLHVAGLFIFAEAIMYYLILNVWYQTWDFVGLDAVVTPLIGILAVGGGFYFLYKYYKSRGVLTCDVSSIEYQSGVEAKIKALVHSPLTILSALGIIGIAFSVNVIEFACSIGIPQAFTKILELNALSFLTQQFYLFIYIFFYMIDDLIVFGLALYGFNKLHLSYTYSRFSSLVGGILMLILGGILLFAPNLLVFGV